MLQNQAFANYNTQGNKLGVAGNQKLKSSMSSYDEKSALASSVLNRPINYDTSQF